jgi:hypothetical protein
MYSSTFYLTSALGVSGQPHARVLTHGRDVDYTSRMGERDIVLQRFGEVRIYVYVMWNQR